MSIIKVSFNHPTVNRDLYFRPLQRTVRGRFLVSRDPEPTATAAAIQQGIPEEIPPQILGVDTDAEIGYLIEPLHHDKHTNVRGKIAKKGYTFEPERQDFPGIDPREWLYWFAAAHQFGKLEIVAGKIPKLEEINFQPPDQLAPKPLRGQARLSEIFKADPAVAVDFMKMTSDQKEKFSELVGV